MEGGENRINDKGIYSCFQDIVINEMALSVNVGLIFLCTMRMEPQCALKTTRSTRICIINEQRMVLVECETTFGVANCNHTLLYYKDL